MHTLRSYAFGPFLLDVAERTLMLGRERIHLPPKTYDVLVALVSEANRLVTKREILDRVWPDVSVEEGILSVHVAALRKALGDSKQSPQYIETVSRTGYRFVAPVEQPIRKTFGGPSGLRSAFPRRTHRREGDMNDPFVGAWKLNVARSQFDANHRPSQGRMTWDMAPDGAYLLNAEGVDGNGRPCSEKPQRLAPDGRPYPVDSLPGLTSMTIRLNPHTLRAEARREDGSLVGEGTYVVEDDGRTMVATTSGFDSQLRPFSLRTVWDRV